MIQSSAIQPGLFSVPVGTAQSVPPKHNVLPFKSDRLQFSGSGTLNGKNELSRGQQWCERMIRWYQKNESIHRFKEKTGLFHCGYKQFGISELSCSQYTIEAIRKNGVIRGIIQGFMRIVMCNPITFKLATLQKYFIKP